MLEGNVTKAIQENKTIKKIGNIGFVLFMLIILTTIFITGKARLTGMEPSLLGYRVYIVDSGSMAPSITTDSIIVVKEILPKQIEKDDIVTYYGNSGMTRVTHRIVEIKKTGQEFITKGDANNTEDPSILQGDRVIGKLALSIPRIGKIFRVLNSKFGITLLIILGGLWIVIPIIVNKFK